MQVSKMGNVRSTDNCVTQTNPLDIIVPTFETSWARPESEPTNVKVDDVGTQYHNVAPPAGVRAEDGVMGGGADFIKPVWGGGGVSLDSSKVCAAFVRGGRVAKTNQCRHALRCMWTCRPTQGCAHWRAAR